MAQDKTAIELFREMSHEEKKQFFRELLQDGAVTQGSVYKAIKNLLFNELGYTEETLALMVRQAIDDKVGTMSLERQGGRFDALVVQALEKQLLQSINQGMYRSQTISEWFGKHARAVIEEYMKRHLVPQFFKTDNPQGEKPE